MSDWVTTVEGRPVQTQVERQAMLGTRDHTALLTRLGIPIAPLPTMSRVGPTIRYSPPGSG